MLIFIVQAKMNSKRPNRKPKNLPLGSKPGTSLIVHGSI